jgi:hypothetical protein
LIFFAVEAAIGNGLATEHFGRIASLLVSLLQVAAMPRLVTPETAPLPEVLVCAHCNRMMRLQGSSPAQHCDNLDQFRYVCDCGWAIEKAVSHQ